MNDYEIIFMSVRTQLQKLEPPLESDKIKNLVGQMKSLIEKREDNLIALNFLGIPDSANLHEDEWFRMIRDLEMHFDVKMDKGFLIQGEDQQKRDTTWWTNKGKSDSPLFYWSRYKELINNAYPPDVIRTIDVDTDVVMNNIANPIESKFDCYGMVVGHVQSGKTANYSALISKAIDAGYKFVIVIAGGINNLRNQTQIRINEAIIGFQNGLPVGVGRLGDAKNSNKPSSLTTEIQDFDKTYATKMKGTLNFDIVNVPVIMVIKKQSNTLSNVIEWLEANYKGKISNHAMLMIDDESDYASVNTGGEDDPTTINKKLRKLMGLFDKSAYIAYTATPYANIFIDYKASNDDYGRDLFPSDFIVALNAPDNYFGANMVFTHNYKKHIVHINDNEALLPLKHKKDITIQGLPESLKEAVRVFIINIAIRYLRGQTGKHNSMLIHVSRFTKIHIQIAYYIEEYLKDLANDMVAYGALVSASKYSILIKSIEETFYKIHDDVEFEWGRICSTIAESIKSIQVREIHQDAKLILDYSNSQINVVAIGGASLSRGYTLEGLNVSYFMRTTKMYDTLMQMGRWFGYRIGYGDICKVYMMEQMGDNFRDIIEATDELFNDFRQMAEAKKTPDDFGLSVTQKPESALQVTANNKMRHAIDYFFDMNLDGSEKETTCLKKDATIRKKNLKVTEKFIKSLIDDDSIKQDKLTKKILWRDVNRNIILNFLTEYEVFAANPVYISSKMPIDFIKKYVLEIETNWDVLLAEGTGGVFDNGIIKFNKEFRSMEDKGSYIQAMNRHISTGSLEKVLFTNEESKGKTRVELREIMNKPLLTIHILDVKTESEIFDNLVAFGISFPGGIKSSGRVIRGKINKVYVDQIIDSMKEEIESDE